MDVTEAANRCLIAGFDGHTAPDELRKLVAEGLGGVILASRNVRDAEQVRALTDSLRAERPDVLVTIDNEGGGIGHLFRAGAPEVPGNWALGVADDAEATAAVARALAGHLVSLGVTVSFAPVADVQREPANPIVRVRSFGAEPDLVARHVRAWTEATLACGVAPCAKHFPGHGSTTVDSHLGLPVDARSERELREVDLPPFRAAVEAGVPLVMTAHVAYPGLDGPPATLSRRILTGLLRGELGYEGVVVTDALEMKAIADEVGEAAGAVRALAAGADAVLLAVRELEVPVACRDSVRAAAADGTLDPERLLEAAARVRALAGRFATPGAVPPYDADAGLRAARAALARQPRPEPVRDPFVVDLFKLPHRALGWDHTNLTTHVRELMPGTDGLAATEGPVDVGDVLRRAAGRPLVVATEDPDMRPWQGETRAALLAARPDAVLVATGMPETGSAQTGPAQAGLATFGRGKANLTAAAELLAGRRA